MFIVGIVFSVEAANLRYHNQLIADSTAAECTISLVENGDACDSGDSSQGRKRDYSGSLARSDLCGDDDLRFMNARGVCYLHDPFQEGEPQDCWVNCDDSTFYITGTFGHADAFLAVGLVCLFSPLLVCLCCCVMCMNDNASDVERRVQENRMSRFAMRKARKDAEKSVEEAYPLKLEDLQGQWRNDDGIRIDVSGRMVSTSASGNQYKLCETWNRFEMYMGGKEWILRKDAKDIVWKDGVRGQWENQVKWTRDLSPPVYKDALRENATQVRRPQDAPPSYDNTAGPPVYIDASAPPGYDDAMNEKPPAYTEINMSHI